MKKNIVVFSVLGFLIVVISGSLGYVGGFYVKGLAHANDSVVRTHCQYVLFDSSNFARLAETSNIADIVRTLEICYDVRADFIQNNRPVSRPATKQMIDEALKRWLKAKEKLRDIVQRHGYDPVVTTAESQDEVIYEAIPPGDEIE